MVPIIHESHASLQGFRFVEAILHFPVAGDEDNDSDLYKIAEILSFLLME